MIIQDEFSQYYEEYLDGTYDCVDRIVLNAYFPWHNPSVVSVHGGVC
ncbi:MAG: hypothetical protein NUV74_02405 [Candidatus Brocadiaceae bacterium]|nr:hypothetical protein [Candidatus Brocadiaceae bacterium]